MNAPTIDGTSKAVSVSVEEREDSVRISTGMARVELLFNPYRLRLHDLSSGKTIVRQQPGGLFYERDGIAYGVKEVTDITELTDGVRLNVVTDEELPATVSLRFLSEQNLEVNFEPPQPESVEAVGDRLVSPESELLYGLTERLRDSPPLLPGVTEIPLDDVLPREVGSLNRRGETVEMRVRPTISLYTPFYQSSRGYGLVVAGTALGAFDLADSDPRTLGFRFETGTSPESQQLVYNLFLGPEYTTILDEYTQLTGRPIVPPDWAFLHWRWRDVLEAGESTLLDGVPVNAQLAEDVLMYEMFDIPPGVYLFDRPVLEGNFGFARWEWDESRLPNPDAMLQSLKDRGYHLALWSSTFMCGVLPGDNGIEALRRGYLAPGFDGLPICTEIGLSTPVLDATNPEARSWWRDKLAEFLSEWGIKGIKLDRGEEQIPSEATDIWFDGRSGIEVRNDYPNLQAQLHFEALEKANPDGDFVLLSRAGYSGTQQDSVFWGGDTAGSTLFGFGPGTDLGLRSAIISQQRAAFMGMPIWGSDTGGYYQFKDRELFARWLQFSAFSGIMEIGGQGTHAPWDMPTEPNFDPELIEIYRRYTKLREILQPYIVAAAREASAGVPLARPMPLVYPRVPELSDRWDQYLFGPDLLVAPVWEIGQRSREVYLPSGTWRNYWDSSQVYQGRQTVTVEAPLALIPVFVRDGAAVPSPDALLEEVATVTSESRLDEVSASFVEPASFAREGSDENPTKQLPLPEGQETVLGSNEADLFVATRDGAFDGIDDVVLAGEGNDEVDSVPATSTNPRAGHNQIYAGGGDDVIFVGRHELVYGGSGNDEFDALDSQGDNYLLGEEGRDRFFLGHGDRLVGGVGDDCFFVGEGGDNILTGGLGRDLFWIANGTIPEQVNVITDFTVGEDLIGLADAASLGIASVENLTQQAKEGGLLLSSFNDPLVFLQEVTAPLREDSFLFDQTIVV